MVGPHVFPVELLSPQLFLGNKIFVCERLCECLCAMQKQQRIKERSKFLPFTETQTGACWYKLVCQSVLLIIIDIIPDVTSDGHTSRLMDKVRFQCCLV